MAANRESTHIPEGWREKTLGEVVDYVVDNRGKTPPITESGYELLEVNAISEVMREPDYSKVSKFVDEETFKTWFRKGTIQEGDVMIPTVGTIGNVSYSSQNRGAIAQNLIALRTNNDNSSLFLYYFLSNSNTKRSLLNLDIGGVQPSIKVPHLLDMRGTFPPLPEQRAIADMLSSFDAKIELLREQNETLEKTAQTIFHEWFGRYSVESPEELPEGWRVGKLEEFIGEIESGKRPKGGVGDIKEGIPSIGAENVKGLLNSNFSSVKLIPEVFFNSMNSGKIKNNDILVYKDGGAPGEFKPNFTIIGDGYPFNIGAINEHVFRVQSKKEYQQYYLFFWLTGRVCIGELKSIGGKAAIPGINGTDFKKLSLLIPNEDYIINFNEKVKPMMKKILSNNSQIQSLSKTRDILLPKLMSGEVRVV